VGRQRYRQPVRAPRPPLLAAGAGLLVGLVAAAVLVAGGSLDGRLTPVPVPDASEAFVQAYQRSLEGTYAVEADYSRKLTDGRTLRARAFVAQRPPDSIRRQFGGISGVVAGRTVACSTDLGTFHCGPSAPAPDPAVTKQRAVDAMRSYFAAPALYRATADGPDCFELTQARPAVTLPYGSEARFCFDPGTGAIRILRQQLEGATDTFEATLVRSEVTVADFDLGPDDAFGAPDDSPGATTTTTD
jgi:hypothetical protein